MARQQWKTMPDEVASFPLLWFSFNPWKLPSNALSACRTDTSPPGDTPRHYSQTPDVPRIRCMLGTKATVRLLPRQETANLHWVQRAFDREGKSFLHLIITCHETCVHYFTPESKKSSKQREHTDSPTIKEVSSEGNFWPMHDNNFWGWMQHHLCWFPRQWWDHEQRVLLWGSPMCTQCSKEETAWLYYHDRSLHPRLCTPTYSALHNMHFAGSWLGGTATFGIKSWPRSKRLPFVWTTESSWKQPHISAVMMKKTSCPFMTATQ